MGGGNGQKSKTKRDRNNEKKIKEAKKKNAPAMKAKVAADKAAIKCKICMTTFMVTAKPAQLSEHHENKHANKGFTIEQCFPHLAAA